MKKKRIFILITAIIALCLLAGLTYYLAVKLPQIREKERWQAEFEQYYAQALKNYEYENEQYEDFEVDVAFIGDSLTAGYDVAHYYPEYLTVNRGIGGETTKGLKNRLDVSVLDLSPKVCVMLIGGNNLDTMFEDYEQILISFKEQIPETKIVLVSLTSMGGDWARKNQLAAYNNVKIKLLVEKYDYEFVDLYTPLFDINTGEIKAEYTTDGAHQTPQGYQVFTDNIKPVIDRLLKS